MDGCAEHCCSRLLARPAGSLSWRAKSMLLQLPVAQMGRPAAAELQARTEAAFARTARYMRRGREAAAALGLEPICKGRGGAIEGLLALRAVLVAAAGTPSRFVDYGMVHCRLHGFASRVQNSTSFCLRA